MANWIDNDPSRYGGMKSGDYGPFPIDGTIHFVMLKITAHLVGNQIEPEELTACGTPVPHWEEDPTSYPIFGVVDCPACLKAMEEDKGNE